MSPGSHVVINLTCCVGIAISIWIVMLKIQRRKEQDADHSAELYMKSKGVDPRLKLRHPDYAEIDRASRRTTKKKKLYKRKKK